MHDVGLSLSPSRVHLEVGLPKVDLGLLYQKADFHFAFWTILHRRTDFRPRP